MRQATLLIYAKPPWMGIAKTRLAKSLASPVAARRIAAFTLSRTLRAARHSGCAISLFVTPDKALRTNFGGVLKGHIQKRSQGRGTLTQRLNKGLKESAAGPVLFIGADAPDLTPGLLRRAVRLLRRNGAVFGPASDGGFWLFGLNKTSRTRSPFKSVRWSGPHALADVRANLPKTAKVAYLPTLTDIDEAEDWQAWQRAQRP